MKKLLIILEDKIYEKLKKIAQEERRSIQKQLNEMIENYENTIKS